ncbi:cytochrome P450 [Truncatella angustata]|uniref:Cytochrome P450 n=1 Tax=Truncatella angustata TaxID=152316 RepID=A0A9P8UJE2_9PEZI|nr:cytochrome P450 [Truncatella angustata]KAH6653320.1 cytochrome P450 [Truncatella angustata]KAH8197063.1 hypothetical protein TruAng_008770 [Truncatella angustata]
MLYELIYALVGLLGLAYVVEHALGLRDDAREPRRVSSRIPLIGHVLGIVKYGTVYYNETSARTEDEIYTLDIIALKIYVSRSRRLIPVIQKASKTLSFRPFVKVVAREMAGNSEPACGLFDGPFVDEYSQVVKTALLPGAHQDDQNLRMADSVISLVNDLVNGGKGKTVGLLGWTQHLIVEASSCGFFGTEHPFQDPEVEKAFWRWQLHLRSHMAGLDFFGKANKEREVVHKAFFKYCIKLQDETSKVVLDRQRVVKAAGMDFEDAAKQETLFCVAMFGNTTPTLYWTIWELFSRPALVEEVRQELEEHAIIRNPEEKDGGDTAGNVLDIAALKTQCPLLFSIFQETQRMHHIHANIRKVMADTFIDNGRYLLRKGNYLQMPGSPIHYDEDVWGPTAKTFDPYRFTENRNKEQEPGSKVFVPPPSGFLAWGTPPHLCPARQFAATEILITVALLVIGCDLVPNTSDGQWEKNPAVRYSDVAAVLTPIKEFDVQVKPREGAGKWTVKMGMAKTQVNLLSG